MWANAYSGWPSLAHATLHEDSGIGHGDHELLDIRVLRCEEVVDGVEDGL